LISGILAAAMSTLSSSMNSGATAYYTDIHQRLNISKHEKSLRIARVATFCMGFLGVLFAVMLANMDIKSLWDEFQRVLGLIIGGLGGVFVLGIFSRRANGFGALIGILGSAAVQYLLSLNQAVHLLLYTATGVISCVVLGLLASFLSKPKDNIDNLVIF
jgi:Na+/proline symporter